MKPLRDIPMALYWDTMPPEEYVEWAQAQFPSDPTEHGLSEPKEYTAWDIEAIEASDLIFAYFETANPYGFNMAYEMGYAEALGKNVIFVNEKFADNDRPASMLVVKSIVTKTLEGGIEALKAVVADE